MSEENPSNENDLREEKEGQNQKKEENPLDTKVEFDGKSESDIGWDNLPNDENLDLFKDSEPISKIQNDDDYNLLMMLDKQRLEKQKLQEIHEEIIPEIQEKHKKSKTAQKEEFLKGLKTFGDKFGKTMVKVGSVVGKGVVQVGTVVGKGVVQVGTAVGKGVAQVGEKIGESIEEKRSWNEQVKEEIKRMNLEKEKTQPEFRFKYKDDAEFKGWDNLEDITKPSNKVLRAPMDSVPSSSLTNEAQSESVIYSLMDEEMREAYKDADEYIRTGQESMAQHYYEFIIQRAKEKSLTKVWQFLEVKIQKLYQ